MECEIDWKKKKEEEGEEEKEDSYNNNNRKKKNTLKQVKITNLILASIVHKDS